MYMNSREDDCDIWLAAVWVRSPQINSGRINIYKYTYRDQSFPLFPFVFVLEHFNNTPWIVFRVCNLIQRTNCHLSLFFLSISFFYDQYKKTQQVHYIFQLDHKDKMQSPNYIKLNPNKKQILRIAYIIYVIDFQLEKKYTTTVQNELRNKEILKQDLPLGSDVTLTIKPKTLATCGDKYRPQNLQLQQKASCKPCRSNQNY